jgi:tetratricopeptide (TPR) repeat protein
MSQSIYQIQLELFFIMLRSDIILYLQLKLKQMSKKRTIIKKRKLSAYVPQIALILLIGLLLQQGGVKSYWLITLAIYILLSVYLKIIIPRWHVKGLFYVRKGEYEGASFAFQKSYNFFNKYKWIDTYRALTLFSVSNFGYKEMALMNIIFCNERLGKKDTVKKYHDRLKKEFPENPYSNM